MNTLNCLLIGQSKVGKTALIQRHLTGQFEPDPTNPSDSTLLPFTTSAGQVRFSITEKRDRRINGNVDCIILIFSLQDKKSFDFVIRQLINYQKMGIDKPIVVCGNKSDLKVRSLSNKIIFEQIVKRAVQYFEISAKSNYNYEKPFLYLAQRCIDPDLFFNSAVPVDL